MINSIKPIVVEHTFATSISNVWHAITILDQMRQWYFQNIPSFKPEIGFKTQFNVKSQDRNFLHLWEVTDVIPYKMIRYNWKYDGYAGDSFVTFELSELNNQTRLRLTHQIVEDFPDDIPEFKRESGIRGWTFFIIESLKSFLENNETVDDK